MCVFFDGSYKEFGSYESYEKLKLKAKYILTADVKEVKKNEVKNSDFDKFIGKEFILPEYENSKQGLTTYKISEIKFDKYNRFDSLGIELSNDVKTHPLIKIIFSINFSISYDDIGRLEKIEIDLNKFQGINKPEKWDYTKFPEIVNFVKVIKKYF